MSMIHLPRVLLAALAALACTVQVASAQSDAPGVAPTPPPTNRDAEPYSEGNAVVAPLVGTAVSLGLAVVGDAKDIDALVLIGSVGVFFSPSLGHVYTRDWRGALIGTGIRAAGVGIFLAGVTVVTSDEENKEGDIEGGAGLLMGLGALTYLGGAVYSFWDAPGSARRANKKHQDLSVTFAPIQGPNRSTGWGAAMQGTF